MAPVTKLTDLILDDILLSMPADSKFLYKCSKGKGADPFAVYSEFPLAFDIPLPLIESERESVLMKLQNGCTKCKRVFRGTSKKHADSQLEKHLAYKHAR